MAKLDLEDACKHILFQQTGNCFVPIAQGVMIIVCMMRHGACEVTHYLDEVFKYEPKVQQHGKTILIS